jgi:TRAP transporter TAXI family solute receptor
MAYVIIVRADSNIKSIADLKGKMIALDKKGTSGYVQTLRMLKLHGLEPGDYKESTQSRGDAAGGFIDGRIDCWFFANTLASPHITKMIASRDVRFLSVDKAKMKAFMEEYPYYELKDYEDFRGLKQSFTWVYFYECTIVGSYLDEELVYQCTKALFENIQELYDASPVYKEYTLEGALNGAKIPVHPGALRYYKEKNVKGWDNPKFQYKPESR